MPKWKIVATDPVTLTPGDYNRALLKCINGKFLSVAGVPAEKIPLIGEFAGHSFLGRDYACTLIAIRKDLTLDNFDIVIVDAY